VLPSFGNEKSRSMCLVQDWQYWGKYGWNAMKSDEDYPHPKEMSPYGPPSASFCENRPRAPEQAPHHPSAGIK
jgi:hypothetical protein